MPRDPTARRENDLSCTSAVGGWLQLDRNTGCDRSHQIQELSQYGACQSAQRSSQARGCRRQGPIELQMVANAIDLSMFTQQEADPSSITSGAGGAD